MEIVIKGKKRTLRRDRKDGTGLVRLDAEALDLLEDTHRKLDMDVSIKSLASQIIIQAIENGILTKEEE